MSTTRDQIIENIKKYFITNEPLIIKNIRSLFAESQCKCEKIKYNLSSANEDFVFTKEDFEKLRIENNITTKKYDNLFSKDSLEITDIDIYCDYLFYSKIYYEMNDHIQKLHSVKTRDNVYFSSYNKDISANDFCLKKVCWFSSRIDQSLLFQLERFRDLKESSPIMFEFNLLHKNINVIFSTNPTNNNVLNFFGLGNLLSQENLLRNFLISMGVEPGLAPDTLAKDNNKYILYLCEAFNNFVIEDSFLSKYSSQICVHGYINLRDQYEIALIKFNEFVDPDSVIKNKYIKVVKNDIEYPVPFGKDFRDVMEPQCVYKNKNSSQTINCVPLSSSNITSTDNLKMSCGNNSNIQIYYQNELTGETNIFDCSNKPENFYWRNKYLKYKQKYLKLKNKN